MTMNSSSDSGRISHLLAGDLGKVLGERALLRLVFEVVQTVDARVLEQQTGPTPEFRPQMMLTLVTYCYAASLFGSRDIQFAIGTDPTVRYICARTYPGWQAIRRFRRTNREFIRHCLVEVMRRAWAHRFDAGEADYAGYEWFETDFADQLEEVVKERLDTAALMDGADSD
jgi:hypothetical protein